METNAMTRTPIYVGGYKSLDNNVWKSLKGGF